MAEIRLRLREADGGLPDVCMRCGEPSTVIKTKNMSWHPPWVIVTILIAWPLYIILALVMTKRARIQAPLCDKHKGHWFNRTMLILGSFFLFLLIGGGALFLAMALNEGGGRRGDDTVAGIVCGVCAVLGLIWLVIIIAAQSTAIRPNEITDRDITLKGVAQEFVDAVEDQDYDDHPSRARRSRYEEEEDEPKPRKKRPPSDAIEE